MHRGRGDPDVNVNTSQVKGQFVVSDPEGKRRRQTLASAAHEYFFSF